MTQCGKVLVTMPDDQNLSIQNSHGRRRKLTPISCSSTLPLHTWKVPLLQHTCHTYIHTCNFKNLKKDKEGLNMAAPTFNPST